MQHHSFSEQDHRFMARAMALAHNGWGLTNPNPLVGCVVVRDGEVLAEGWHRRYGDAHAEAMALNALEDAEGATVYVNLEPCNHTGKTPPCSELILRKKAARVVYAMEDPNPVAGGGGVRLTDGGVRVESGLMRQEAMALNAVFTKWATSDLPYVVLKYAMTLDGKIASRTGSSRWITGEEARARVHHMRQRYSAIMIGRGTAQADNPQLTVRNYEGEASHPLRVVVDSQGSVSAEAEVFKDQDRYPTLLATTESASQIHCDILRERGVGIWRSESGEGPVDIVALLRHLRKIGIDSVLVEGGAGLHGALMDLELPDLVTAFIAPKLIGGISAPGPVGGEGRAAMSGAVALTAVHTEMVGGDILITGVPTFGKEAPHVHRPG